MAEQKMSVEEAMKRLDEIATEMAKEDITLEASFKLYNEGVVLVKDCRSLLTGVEKQMRVLEEEEENNDGI